MPATAPTLAASPESKSAVPTATKLHHSPKSMTQIKSASLTKPAPSIVPTLIAEFKPTAPVAVEPMKHPAKPKPTAMKFHHAKSKSAAMKPWKNPVAVESKSALADADYKKCVEPKEMSLLPLLFRAIRRSLRIM